MKQSGFTENRGQWDSRALFLTGKEGKNVWVTRDGFVVDIFHNSKVTDSSGNSSDWRRGHVIRFELEGSNKSATATGAAALPGRIDYMQAADKSRVVTTGQYAEAYVNGVYPGVDLRTYLDGGDFRYDLVAKPGADTSRIGFKIHGSDRVRLDSNGSLVIETSMGPVKQSRPIVYQQVGATRKEVPAKFTVSGSRVGFELGSYNRSLPLVIDPLVYGSYAGADRRPGLGNSDDVVYDGAADSAGNLYMTGYTLSVNFPVLNGPYGFNNQGNRDAFIARMAADAYALDYAAFIGGTGRDEGRGIEVAEEAGYVWIGGVTSSANFPGSNNAAEFDTLLAADPTHAAFWFLQFRIASGNILVPRFSRYYNEMGKASFAYTREGLLGFPYPTPVGNDAWWGGMAAAPNGVLYFAGDSANVPTNVPLFATGASRGGRDGFITRIDTGLVASQRRSVGSRFNDTMGRIAATPDNGVILVGTVFADTNQDTANPGSDPLIFPTTSGVYSGGRLLRRNDAFIVKLNSNLSVGYSAVLGGASNDRGIAVAADQTGAAYVLCYGGSFDFPRTRGVYDAVNDGVDEDIVAKISPTGNELVYSTGLRHSGVVFGTDIAVDRRGVAVVGGTVGFSYPGGTPPQPMSPGSIPTTADAIDPNFTGGNDSVFPSNRVAPDNTTGFRATYEGFVQVLNPTGTNVLYASYLGGGGDEEVNAVHVDRVGATWVLGYTQVAANAQGGTKADVGIPAHITANAFKERVDSAGEARDGFAIKLRVGLPRLTGISVSQAAIAGGLGASTNGTVTLAQAAPAGGVVVNLELSNPTVTSFAPNGGQSRLSVVVPAGATTATFPIYSSPVVAITNSTLRATLDNDFLVTEISVNPWLTEMTTTPGLLVGGNQVNLILRLFQPATQEIRVPITTANSSLIVPPTNSEVIIPAGQATASVLLETGGVEATTDVGVTGSLLGVVRATSVTLTRAELTAVSFNPNRILGGESTTMTISFNGKVGADRQIALTRTSGAAVTFTTPITIRAQQSSVSTTVTAPLVTASSSSTIQASSAGFSARQTLFIDPIDILNVQLQPGTNVLGGTLVTGRVNLTRPAGQTDILINLASSNANAGTLNVTTVRVPAGQSQSDQFEFQTNITGTDVVTTISASRTGLTTRRVDLTVRGISVAISVDPSSVLGGSENATVALSIGTPAPAGGLTINLSSNGGEAAVVSPASVVIPAGATTPAAGTVITVTTTKVPTVVNAVITASLSPLSVATDTLQVRPPAVTALTLSPSQLSGGSSSTATVTLEVEAPEAGMTVNLSSSDPSATVPATVAIAGGATTATFQVSTTPVSTSRQATITAAGSLSSASAVLSIEAASVGRVTFNPSIVRGGQGSTGTVTLNTPAPAGGLVLNIVSDTPSFARPTVTSITIPAGQTSRTFPVTTSRTSRRVNIGFTVTIAATGTSGRGFLGVRP